MEFHARRVSRLARVAVQLCVRGGTSNPVGGLLRGRRISRAKTSAHSD